jgi:ABC-type dipeptide/oligopeptide/nickel transport system permease component
MIAYLLRRLFWFVPVFFVVTALTFWTVRKLPGGPFDNVGDRQLPEYVVRNKERKYGLDKPIWRQYLYYLGDLARLDFGMSYAYEDREVSELLGLKFVEVDRTELDITLRQTPEGNLVLVEEGEEYLLKEGPPLILRSGTKASYVDRHVTIEHRSDLLFNLPIKILSPEERLAAVQYQDEWVPLKEGTEIQLDDGTQIVSEKGQIIANRDGERLVLGWTQANRLAVMSGKTILGEVRANLRVEIDRMTYVTVDGEWVKMQRRTDLPIKYTLYPQTDGGWAITSKGVEEPIALEAGYQLELPGDLVVEWDGSHFQAAIRRVEIRTQNGFPISVRLGLMAISIALFLGVGLGIIAALRHNSLIDYGATLFAILGVSVPNLVLGPVLIWIFALKLNWLDLKWTGSMANYILPAIALGTGMAASIARLTRASLLQVIQEDYMRTARAKGLANRTVILRHALKNSLIPVVTILGPMFAGVITGAIVTEQIFAIPGMGRFFIDSISNRDYPVVMATTLIFAILIVLANLAVDISYGVMDPRIRYA